MALFDEQLLDSLSRMPFIDSAELADSNLFSGANIVSGSYDVVVHAQEGRTLDVVTDLNGASKRALTLSLIWALMEVAEREAPRIIDTPLGMTSGAVKHQNVKGVDGQDKCPAKWPA